MGIFSSWADLAHSGTVSVSPLASQPKFAQRFLLKYFTYRFQEAKQSCRGRWYLPAGRLEPDETLVEGVKREVLEETGLRYEPETILCMEMYGVAWQRVTFIGRATSGRLKPKPDEESLDAKWMKYPDLKSQPIRSGDIFPLIELGLEYLKLKRDSDGRAEGFAPVMPIERRFERIFLRLALMISVNEDGHLVENPGAGRAPLPSHVLVDDGTGHLPVLGMGSGFAAGGGFSNVKKVVTIAAKHLTKGGLKELTCQGLLATEHDGRKTQDGAEDVHRDGMCHTFYLKIAVESLENRADGFKWERLDEGATALVQNHRLLPAVMFL